MKSKKVKQGFPFFSMSINKEGTQLSKKHRTIEASKRSALEHYKKTKNNAISGKLSSNEFSLFGGELNNTNNLVDSFALANIQDNNLSGTMVDCYYAYCEYEEKRVPNSKSATHQEAQDKADDHYATYRHKTTVETVYKRDIDS